MKVDKLKWFVIFMVMFLTAYPVMELTRCIIQYNILDSWGIYPLKTYYLELALIWGFYITIPVILHLAFEALKRRR